MPKALRAYLLFGQSQLNIWPQVEGVKWLWPLQTRMLRI